MVHKFKQKVLMPNSDLSSLSSRLTAGTGIGQIGYSTPPVIKARIPLAGLVISITAANDYGGAKLVDFPNKNLMLKSMLLNAKGNILTPNVGTDLTLSLGTAVAAATPLATTAIDYMIAKTGVGAAQAFTVVGHSFDNTSGNFGNAGATPYLLDNGASNSLFLNAAAAVASGTCTVTFTGGYVDVYYEEMDEPVALT